MEQQNNYLRLPVRDHTNDFLKPIQQQPQRYLELYPQDHVHQEKIPVITYYAMIMEGEIEQAPTLNSPIKYATKSVHTELNLPSTIKDPVMTFKIIDNNCNIKFKKVVPLKHTFNLNDGSLLMTVQRDGSRLYPNIPPLRDKQLLIKIVCAKNPKLIDNLWHKTKDNSFALQRYSAKKSFFKEPTTWIDTKDNVEELIKAGVIENIGTGFLLSSTNFEGDQYRQWKNFTHGPHGCPNDKILQQSIIEEKIPLNISCFKALRNRELTGSFRKKL